MMDDYEMTFADKLTVWLTVIAAFLIAAGLGFGLI